MQILLLNTPTCKYQFPIVRVVHTFTDANLICAHFVLDVQHNIVLGGLRDEVPTMAQPVNLQSPDYHKPPGPGVSHAFASQNWLITHSHMRYLVLPFVCLPSICTQLLQHSLQ